MTLTQQFLVVSILPLSLLGMAVYLWRADVARRPLRNRWIATLVIAALWSSSVFRFYGGQAFPEALVYSWGVASWYLFSLWAVMVLSVTQIHFSVPKRQRLLTLGISGVIFALALALDPAIWGYDIPNLSLVGITIRHFDLWTAVWVTSWILPILSSWIVTRQIQRQSPHSLYRNQIRYWLLMLIIFAIGGLFVSIHEPGQPLWQQLGMLIIIFASLIGTISIGRGHLPDLRVAARLALGQLSATLIIFGVTWGALVVIVRGVANLPANVDPDLILILAAAIFAALFTLVYRGTTNLMRRIFLTRQYVNKEETAVYGDALAHLPTPEALGALFLSHVQAAMMTDDALLFDAEDGPGGLLILRPFASLKEELPETADFHVDSPFTVRLRSSSAPLAQYDIDQLPDFSAISEPGKAALAAWDCALYVPLRVGDSLIGLLGLGKKQTGDAYGRDDFTVLAAMGSQIAPFLAQARNIANLRRTMSYAFRQNQTLAREKQHLEELSQLYTQFVTLVSPELRRPFTPITDQLRKLDELAQERESRVALAELSQHIKQAQTNTEQLVNMASRIQQRGDFQFELVRVDDIVLIAIRNLATMAEARRVDVVFEPETSLPPILGDEVQLREAVQNLLHNAIKFNKIGGRVIVECFVEGPDLSLSIRDIGVGISPQRMDKLWTGFSSLTNSDNRGSGSGLGLSLAQFIVAAHGGRIFAESDYGSGSVFSVHLPLVFEET